MERIQQLFQEHPIESRTTLLNLLAQGYPAIWGHFGVSLDYELIQYVEEILKYEREIPNLTLRLQDNKPESSSHA